MTTTITITVRDVNGEPMLDPQAMALAFGVEERAVCALPIVDGHMRIPREWARRGVRRAKEALRVSGGEFSPPPRRWAHTVLRLHPRRRLFQMEQSPNLRSSNQ